MLRPEPVGVTENSVDSKTFFRYNVVMVEEAQANKTEDELLTIQDAAKEADLTEAAIRNAIYRGKLSTIEKYGRKLIRRVDFNFYRQCTKVGRPPLYKAENSQATE